MAANDPTYKDLSRIKDRTNNVIYNIKALGLKDSIQIALSGDVTGTATTDLHSNVTINDTIEEGAVTHSKLATDSVQNDKIKDGEITKAKFNPSVYNEVDGTIADGTNANLATKTQVKAYVESKIASEGHYKGVQSVATINTWTAANLHNGDRVITSSDPEGSGTGTLTLGNLPVVDGQEVIFYVSDDQSVKIWQSSEGNYKIKQASKSDPTASGTTITAIDTIEQNTNGEIIATKKTIRSATTSQTGVVLLAGSVGATVSSENNKAASEKAVRDAINALDGNATSTDGTNFQVKVTETDGIVSAVNVTVDNTENRNNKVTSWSSTVTDTHYPSEKLVKESLDAKAGRDTDAVEGNIAEFDANGNPVDSGHALSEYKTKQTAVTDPTASGNSYSFIDTIEQNTNGEIIATKKTVPDAAASTSGVGGTKGLMSASDKEKLDGVSAGATKVEGSVENGNIKIDGTETSVYSHPTAGANVSKGDTTAQTPGFGGTFKALSATVDSYGHTTSLAEHNVTIPDDVATPSTDGVGGSAGLMSAADKEKLDDLSSGEATKDKDEVIAAALDDLDARMGALEESVCAENLGTRTADEIDSQVLKIGGDDVATLLAGKVDKVEGKGLSKNDFTDDYKSAVDANTSARHTHSNKSVLDGISSSDITNWNGKQAALTWMTDAEVDALWENAMMAAIAE